MRSLTHVQAAVHIEDVSGDVGRVIGGEERDCTGHVFRSADASQRNFFSAFCLKSSPRPAVMAGLDEAGCDGVASYVARAQFARDGLGQANQACFGGGVVGLSGLADLAKNASDIDDASPALFQHGTDDLLRAQVGGSEVGIEDRVPVGALHSHDELIARDAGVVDEDVNLAKLGEVL